MVAEQAQHLLRLALPQQAVIDEDAGELVADRLVDQDRGDGGIHAAGEAADHLALAHLGADSSATSLGAAAQRMVQSPLHAGRSSCTKLLAGASRHRGV